MDKTNWPKFECVFHAGAKFNCCACGGPQLVTDNSTELCLECWRAAFLPLIGIMIRKQQREASKEGP